MPASSNQQGSTRMPERLRRMLSAFVGMLVVLAASALLFFAQQESRTQALRTRVEY